jgi:hypothetical protein
MKFGFSWAAVSAVAILLLASPSHSQNEEVSTTPTIGPEFVRSWLEQLNDISNRALSSRNPSGLVPFLERMNFALRSQANVAVFRQIDDQKAIGQLANIATFEDPGVRFNVSSILANVTDNTTLCVVLDKILDRDIDMGARFNLLQTAKVVAGYATRENAYWIRSVVQSLRGSSNNSSNLARTLQTLDQIEQALDSEKDQFRIRTLLKIAPTEYQQCLQLPSIASFHTQLKSYRLYIHSNQSTAPATLKQTLIDAGFSEPGFDEDKDPAGGLSVDYSLGGDSKKNRNVALLVADTINALLAQGGGGRVAPRPQSAPISSALGIWF